MGKPRICVIEVPGAAEYFKQLLESHFGDKVEVELGYTASDLWNMIQTQGRPDVIMVQSRISYGHEILDIDPDINSADGWQEHTGSRILRYIHEHAVVLNTMFVVLVDGRDSEPSAGSVDNAAFFLREHDLLSVEYQKPFDFGDLVGRLCERFGWDNPYGQLSGWTPEHSVRVDDDPEEESEG